MFNKTFCIFFRFSSTGSLFCTIFKNMPKNWWFSEENFWFFFFHMGYQFPLNWPWGTQIWQHFWKIIIFGVFLVPLFDFFKISKFLIFAYGVSIPAKMTMGNSNLASFLKNYHFWVFLVPLFDFSKFWIFWFFHMGYRFQLKWP